jgi:hypothetical protein
MSKPNSKPNSSNRWIPVEAPPQVKPLTPEWMLYQFLVNWTPQDLEIAIRKNVEINLGPFWGYVENMVINEVLNWFKTYRPDLHKVLATEDGIQWLRMNIRKLTQI